MRLGGLALTVAICCTWASAAAQDASSYRGIDGDVRLAALRHAQVWRPTDVSSVDIKAGPSEPGGFPAGETVTCEYEPEKLTGTPKFECVIPPDDKVRVKYGEANGEVYAEAAATRLLWALGFGADRIYPVRVVCKGCPPDPMRGDKPADGFRTYELAIIERRLAGDQIEISRDSGWSWVELSFVDQTSGGAPLAHRDALKLLAAMIQHTDNKPQQQRLLCLDKALGLTRLSDGRCLHPFMMVNDLGKTFGRATLSNADQASAVNLHAWSGVPVWKDAGQCVAHLAKSFTGSLEHPKISEGGRQFLSDLLSQLSDRQLRDLFELARFTTRDRATAVDDWVSVFKRKRDEIATARCTNPVL